MISLDGKLILSTVMDTYPHTAAIKSGAISTPKLGFTFHDEYHPVHNAFKKMVREDDFDLSELALATAFQAISVGKPLVLLPVAMLSRFHHGSLVTTKEAGLGSPADLNGKSIAVRSYSQTTGLWVRGVLTAEYGVDLDSVTWVTFEEGHVAECQVPPNVVSAPASTTIEQMLLGGEVSAAIVGRQRSTDPRIIGLIPDPNERAMAWYERTQVMPVNHMMVLSQRVIDAHQWVVAELWDMLKQARSDFLAELPTIEAANADQVMQQRFLKLGYNPLPFGVDALIKTMEVANKFCVEQRLIERPLNLDQIFPAAVRFNDC